jgi:hypothetical protein
MIRFLLFWSLIFGVTLVDAQTRSEEWQQRYESYYSSVNQSKVYLLFNQEKFVPGDTAFYKAYMLSTALVLVPGKHLVDVYFLNSSGEKVTHHITRINDGVGIGQFVIPETISSGFYTAVAQLYGFNAIDSTKAFFKHFPVVTKKTIALKERPFKISVEGGSLLVEEKNEILISTSPHTQLRLIEGIDNLVQNIRTDRFGFCRFSFSPKVNHQYFIKVEDENIKRPLPPLREEGVSLHLSFRNDKPFSVWLKVQKKSKNKSQRIWATFTGKGKVFQLKEMQLGEDSLEVSMPERLPNGLIRFCILDQNGVVLAYRNFYSKAINRVVAAIELQKTNFLPREKVSGFITFKRDSGQQISSDYLLKVVNMNMMKDNSGIFPIDLLCDLNLKYDQFPLDHLFYDSSVVDNMLLSYSEADPWMEIIAKDKNSKGISPKRNLYKTGKVVFLEKEKHGQKLSSILFYFQKSGRMVQTAVQDESVYLFAPDFFGDEELLYLGDVNVNSNADNVSEIVTPEFDIQWVSDSVSSSKAPIATEGSEADPYFLFKANKKIIDQSYSTFAKVEMTAETRELNENTKLAPDLVINLADYTPFLDMQELIREVVPSLQCIKRKYDTLVRIPLSTPFTTTGDPVYVIDGIATKNTRFFLSLKLADLTSIAIINQPKKLLSLGLFGKNGVVIVQSKKGGLREPIDTNHTFKGLTKPMPFKPVAVTEQKMYPDFRSTLLWSPLNKSEFSNTTNFEFLLSDDVGEKTIFVKGVTKDGLPFSATKKINVSISGNE